MARRSVKTGGLREACIGEALAIIEEGGVEKLSLREVARRLGVSHQAPYKHFPSRDHILAELVARAFAAFAAHLDARPVADDPQDDLAGLGAAYLDYASRHPLQYRLMFGTPLPDPADHPEMMRNARHAFAVLQATLGRMPPASGRDTTYNRVTLDALFIWSAVHGIASMQHSSAIATLGLSRDVLGASPLYSMNRLRAALTPEAMPGSRVGRRRTSARKR